MIFVKEEFLHNKTQKKRCFRKFDQKTYERRVVWNSMDLEAFEGYKVIEKFEKVCS